MTEQNTATNLIRSAYENRYTWDKNFPGYTADVIYKHGDQVYTGKVRVNSNVSVEVIDVADESAKQAIAGQMQEIAIHRIRRTFEESHGKNTFSLGETDETGATEIFVGGRAEGDRYKVRDRVVTLVHRHIHNIVVTINTFTVHNTSEGYLSHRYDSVYHDPKTAEQKGGISDFEDNYEKVGNYYILTSRVIYSDEDEQPLEFSFSNVKLLQPAVV